MCRRCTLPRAEHVVLLWSLSSVPLIFLATSRYRASSICFFQLVSLLIPLLFSGAMSLLFLSWLNAKKGFMPLQSTRAQSTSSQEQVQHA